MASADEDNFDIDIYGDGEGGDVGNDGNMDYQDEEEEELQFNVEEEDVPSTEEKHNKPESVQSQPPPPGSSTEPARTEIKTESEQATMPTPIPSRPAAPQGVKRKETSDERPVDHGATNALMISDLHWWTTEDDLRGWVNEADAEDELRDLTFSEHKVNGKSKGQVYLEFSSPQASTAAKHKIESKSGTQPSSRKHTVVYTNATQNPFKTLPKDAPLRARDERPARGGFNSAPRGDYSMNNGGYRGRGGGGFNRGGYNQNNHYNRNFSPPMGGGYNNQNQNMGFQNNMGMANNYGGGFNRGGMMSNNPMRGGMGGMRGGRGGMNNMMGMGGGMGMGNMGMNPMMAGMGMGGFQGGTQFNPAMFNNQGQGFGGQGDWNQHGAKRQRQE